MSVEATRWAWAMRGLRSAQKLILLALADRAGDGNTCWPSMPRLAEDTGLDVKTVRASLRDLVSVELISDSEILGRGHVYTLLVDKKAPTKNGTPTEIGTATKNGSRPLPKTVGGATKNGSRPLPKTVPESKRESIKNLKENLSTLSASEPPLASPGAAHADKNAEPVYVTRKGKKLTGKRLQAFNRFWTAFSYPKGKAEAADAWLAIPQLTDTFVAQILSAAEREAAARPGLVASGRTPKWAQGWITGKRWEDVVDDNACSEKTLDELLAERGIA